MDKTFDAFSEIPDINLESNYTNESRSVDNEKMINFFKDLIRRENKRETKIKKLKKQVKKKNRKIKQLKKHDKALEKKGQHILKEESATDDGRTILKNNSTKTNSKMDKPFLNRLGEAFLKVFPSILKTVVTMAVTAILGRSSKRIGNPRRWQDEKNCTSRLVS